MNTHLLEINYVLDEIANIWARPGYGGIAYSDGDEVEQRIATIIDKANDISVLSSELRQHCTDWASLYHLTSARANILRPFESDLGGDILEIGAGCGAITRYLGECGGNVLALEGSPRRAAIARSRTRDLRNVAVVSDKFDRFEIDQQFDVITLIGVFEYANLFTTGESPALAMLERVRSLLKPNGKLFIAIENQLGLKYFAGAPEDHLGQPMYGIEGRYRKDQPQTYGRVVLQKMLRKAGFEHTTFMAPFPDYKLPNSIVTEAGFNAEDFDASAFAWQSVRRDPQIPPVLGFSPELVWPTLEQNGLALDLANSFLIRADKHEKHGEASSVYAWHFSTERAKQFCKQTTFQRVCNGAIELRYRLLSAHKPIQTEGRLLRFSIPEKAEYVQGKPLSQEFIHIVSRDGWSIGEIGNFFERYMVMLKSIAQSKGISLDVITEKTQLPGELFDWLPQNIIVDDFGDCHVIDEEWTLRNPIPANQLVFRASLSLVNLVSRYGMCADQAVNSPIEFFQVCYVSMGFNVTNEEIENLARRELEIHAEVSQRATDSTDVHAWLNSPSLPRQTLTQALFDRDIQITSLKQSISEREDQIARLLASHSWRLTKPFRFFRRALSTTFRKISKA